MNICLIIPVYKGESTIAKTLDSLLLQSVNFSELIIINDGSPDNSEKIILEYIKGKKIKKCRLITHKKPVGLAATYNEGIKLADSELVVTLHQDVVLFRNSLKILIRPFERNNSKIVASYHLVLHPIKVWKKYNFWQKVFFSRLVGKKFYGLDGKFDCFRKSALKRIGLFDQKHFRTASEDGEIIFRLRKIGRLEKTEAKIVHLHQVNDNFCLNDIIKKQGQYSEAQGVMLRRGVIRSPKQIVSAFFREFLLLLLLLPHLYIIGILLIMIYTFYYTKTVYLYEYKNPRILILPFINIFLLFVSFYFSLRGIIRGKQSV